MLGMAVHILRAFVLVFGVKRKVTLVLDWQVDRMIIVLMDHLRFKLDVSTSSHSTTAVLDVFLSQVSQHAVLDAFLSQISQQMSDDQAQSMILKSYYDRYLLTAAFTSMAGTINRI